MNKEEAYRWADALESGEYPQGKNALFTQQRGYCCLGVKCAISSLHRVDWEELDTPSNWMLEFLNLKDRNGSIHSLKDRDGVEVYLTDLNDHHLTFSQIADLIRYFYEDL